MANFLSVMFVLAHGIVSTLGDGLTVQCKVNPDPSGNFKYDCSGVNRDAVTLKTEHILWLENHPGSSQNLDIEIPNYSLDEYIKAAYKALDGQQDGAKINILLKKPDVTYKAEKGDAPKQTVGAPAVSVNYQPVDKVSVHYPTQKQYANGGGSSAGASGGSNGGSSGSNGGSSSSNGGSSGSNGGSSSSNGGSSGGFAAAPSSSAAAPGNSASSGGGAAPAAAGGAGAYNRRQRETPFKYYFVRQES